MTEVTNNRSIITLDDEEYYVHSVHVLGVIIVDGKNRTFIPWHQVKRLHFHGSDLSVANWLEKTNNG